MPAGRTEPGAKPSGAKRPPWVRDGPQALPMPSAPWANNKRASLTKEPDTESLPPRKPSSSNGQGSQSSEKAAEKSPHVFERPVLRPTNKEPPSGPTGAKLQSREVKVPVQVTRRESKDVPTGKVTRRESASSGRRVSSSSSESEEEEPTSRRNSWLNKVELKPVVVEPKKKTEVKLPKVELKPIPKDEKKDSDIDKMKPSDLGIILETPNLDSYERVQAIPSERNAIVRNESMILKKLTPVPPPMPPMPPPPPPPDAAFLKRDPLNRHQIEKLESLRSRPRKRPDWGAMMKDIEVGKKLKKVQCNDRSQPLLPKNKAKEGQFIYESEQANLHNQLLKQIQTGSKLKHVKTNDRSKPILEGLRKFRRQMTIEEQIQKSQSMAMMPEVGAEVEEEVDEMDDIDKVRDDLQSTKQMLALELRNKEAQIRENKRLLSRLQSLEAEIEKMKADTTEPTTKAPSSAPADDKIVKSLKDEVHTAKKTAEDMEKKYHDTADQLDAAKNEIDEQKRQNRELEKKLQQAMQGIGLKRQSFSDRRESMIKPPPEEEEEEYESESEDSGGEETEEKKQRRAEREIRMLGNKIKSFKNKQEAAKKERKMLREQMKKNQQLMKEEKKKFKNLQKEVNKMAALMKDDEEDDEDAEEESEEEEETEEEDSSSESSSSESEEESSDSDDSAELPLDERRTSLQGRVKRREACLNALKKGNYLLKANADRLQDDLNKQKEAVASLQEDLDSVLAELG